MDRRVKERLVGAAILVVLVVLIVPELLSGPKRAVVVPQATLPGATQPIRSVTIDLATNKATAATEEAAASAVPTDQAPGATGSGDAAPTTTTGAITDAADDGPAHGAADPSPESVTPTPRAGTPGPLSSSASASPVPPATPLENAATSPRSRQVGANAEAMRPGWAAQLGSFAARGNAEKLERQLRTQGFSPFLASTGSGRALRYRVRVGPVADRAAAEKMIVRLQKAGHAASVVAP